MYFEQIPVDHVRISCIYIYIVLYTQNYPEECATALIPLSTYNKRSLIFPNRDLRHVQLESPGGTGQAQLVNMGNENGWTMLNIAEPTKTIEGVRTIPQREDDKVWRKNSSASSNIQKPRERNQKGTMSAPRLFSVLSSLVPSRMCTSATTEYTRTTCIGIRFWDHNRMHFTRLQDLNCKWNCSCALSVRWYGIHLLLLYNTVHLQKLWQFGLFQFQIAWSKPEPETHEALMQSDKILMLSILPGLNSAWIPRWRLGKSMQKRSSPGSKSDLSKSVMYIHTFISNVWIS